MACRNIWPVVTYGWISDGGQLYGQWRWPDREACHSPNFCGRAWLLPPHRSALNLALGFRPAGEVTNRFHVALATIPVALATIEISSGFSTHGRCGRFIPRRVSDDSRRVSDD